MKGRSYQANFTMGELAEDMLGRVDLAAYVAGLKSAENIIPAVTGPARRRPGFMDEGAPKFQTRAWRGVPFQRSTADRFSLEFGHLYVRFFYPNGAPVLDGDAPYEIVSPYQEADLAGLDFAQSNDVLFIAHASGEIPPHALVRRGLTDWAFVELQNVNGPWRTENSDDDFTLEASGSTGTVTLTASKDLFQPGHVGALFRLREQSSGSGIGAWTVELDLAVEYEAAISDGKIYYSVGGALEDSKTGTNPPVHERGTANDGLIDWTYVHDGAGIVRITAVTDAQHATGEVLATLPTAGEDSGGRRILDPGVSYPFGPSPYWAECAWSDYRGWPKTVTDTDEERLAFGGTRAEPGFLALTRTAGYTPEKLDFHPGQGTGRVLDDDGITRQIAAGGDPILWLIADAYLLVGTSGREFAFLGETLDDPLTPSGSRAKRLSRVGSRQVKPVAAHDGVVFVPRGGRGLHMLKLSADQVLEEDDLALFAEDIVAGRIAGLAWAPHPGNVLWAWTDAGELLSLVYHPKQRVFGWQRHPLAAGFLVEWAWVIHDDDGFDTLWLAVKRDRGGEIQRRIWRQAQRWRKGDPASRIIYLDGARLYEGEPTRILSGLDHWRNERVRVFGDGGRVLVDAVVNAAGQILLEEEVESAVVGRRYTSKAQVMPLDVAGPGGTVGQLQRVTEVTVYLSDVVRAEVRFGDGEGEQLGGLEWAAVNEPQAAVLKGKVGAQTDRQAVVSVEMDDAWPGTILAIAAKVTADD